jgi:multicomponent Na+:H+ antiporter subunit D
MVLLPIFIGTVQLIFRKYRKFNIAISFIYLIFNLLMIIHYRGENFQYTLSDWGNLGITVGYDGMTEMFLIASLIVFSAVIFNSLSKNYPGFFYSLISILYGSLNSIFVSRDLFNVFVSVELASICVFILIVFQKKGAQIWASLKYLLISSFGFNVFLLGIGIVYTNTGTFSFEALNTADEFSALLIFGGLSVKSGLFFLSLWLPDAHSKAPTEVSAILSGVIVKIQVYLAIRFLQYESFQWLENIYVIVGWASAIVGVIFAINAKNVKRILAYHTLSQVGFMFAVPDIYGAEYAFNHAIFKSLLFLVVGNIYEKTGIINYKEMKGKITKIDYIPLMIGSLAIMGFPLTDGYVAKHELFIHCSTPGFVILSIASVGTVISFSKFIFLGYSKGKKGKFIPGRNIAYYLLVSVIFYIGIRFFTFSDIQVTIFIIAIGIVIYFLVKNRIKPLDNRLERLDNALLIYISFIAFLVTYLKFFII